MPSGSFKQVDVLCPFYKHDDGKKRITCEGLIDKSCIALIYHNKADYERQIDVFCSVHYEKCEVYRMLIEKYDD